MAKQPWFLDSHAHLDFPDYDADRFQVVARAHDAGIWGILCVGTDFDSSRRALEICQEYKGIHAVAGWHPNHVMEASEDIRTELMALARHPKVVALGETGLDYYRMPSQQAGGTVADDEAFKRKQAEIFGQQLEVAAEAGLNVVIHQRGDVLRETLEMLRPYKGKVRPQFHCFNGDEEALGQVLELDGVVSFTGILTFKNAEKVRDVLKATPMGKFMLETDCPFLAPVPHRGKRCEPAYVKEIAAVAAAVKGCSLEELSEATNRTAREFFPKLEV